MEIEETKDYSSSHLIPNEIKWVIVFLKKRGASSKSVSKVIFAEYGRRVDHKGVKRIWERFQETKSIDNLWSTAGRPQLLTDEDLEALTQSCLEDRISSVKERKEDLELEASRETINRRLLDLGFRSYRAGKKPLLNSTHVEKRFTFALEYEDWTSEDWQRVVFTDECAFRLVCTNGRTVIRRRESEEWEEGTFQFTSSQGKCVIVWGAISSLGAGPLVRFEGNVTAQDYIAAFRYRLKRYYPELYGGNMIYMHDNAPIHKADVTTNWFEGKNIEILQWPPLSPDLNIIENVWGRIKYELRTKVFTTEDEIWEEVEHLWKTLITREFILGLYESLPRRIAAVLENSGRHTKY